MLSAAVDEALPSAIPPAGYTLGRMIATGGSALVYSVSARNGSPAILKWGRWRDRDIHERFAHEAEVLQALGAPLTPAYLAHGELDGWPYLLMEEVSGETLAAWMSRSGSQGALGEIVAILLRLARVIQAIHARGYIHRDLKPENVVIGTHNTRVLDFGLAMTDGEPPAHANVAAGTVHYLAPEQLRTGSIIDRRSDIYSFGVIVFEMIAGQPPFIGERRALEYQHQLVRPPSLREIRQIPQPLEDFVLACLAKEPDARPPTMDAVIEQLVNASAYIQTIKGMGSTSKKGLGSRDRVVLAWIENGDPISVARAINDVHGFVVRSRGGSLLVAFAAQFHDAPLAVALEVCRGLARNQCRVVIHAASLLVRRSAQGKPAFYGPEIEQLATWTPSTVFTGLVLTSAAADLAQNATSPAADVPGFFRDGAREFTDSTDIHPDVPLAGREELLQQVAAVTRAGGVLIGIFGGEGTGKTRVLGALVERLQAATKREVILIRGRRRLLGDRPDDERLVDALGGSGDLAQALADITSRRAMLVIDDVHLFSTATREQLLRDDIGTSRVIASREPLFEVVAGVAKRVAIQLPPLPHADAIRLLRHLLEPARLIPVVLLERLVLRASGNPGLLVALARDIKHRGGIRRQPGSDDWYVAADELDTLLASPSASWLANMGLAGLPVDVAPVARVVAALGPKFDADEVAAASETSDALALLRKLGGAGLLAERNGWFEFVDASLQDAIYEHALDDHAAVHARALCYWLAHRIPNVVGWLARIAHHAIGCGELATAAASATILAREARKRGEEDVAVELEQRMLGSLVGVAPTGVIDAMRAFDEL